MLTDQLEDRLVVIKLDLLPAFGRMAPDTLCAERALMRVILAMAIQTSLRRTREIGRSACIDVTLVAPDAGVLARQLKRRLAMIKAGIAINAVVAGPAVTTEILNVRDEIGLVALMARFTPRAVECRQAAAVTIGAREGLATGLRLMPSE
jgi:hypothetical protein